MTPETATRQIAVVGSGTVFLSGISYYTHRLATELAGVATVSVILMRKLLPAAFYPGRQRVGADLASLEYAGDIAAFDGVDWASPASALKAARFLRRRRPALVTFQWWTATTLHWYLFLALITRSFGGKVVIEFHEVQDVGEEQIGWVRRYTNAMLPLLVRMSVAIVVHSEFDRALIAQRYRLRERPVALIPHGPYDQYGPGPRERPAGPKRILYFGVIRPFKGVEDLVAAFELLPDDYTLTIVGEVWEGWQLPLDAARASPRAHDVTIIDRYVRDDEVPALFDAADIVVLPYHRSSSSGPLQIAMSRGLPVVVTAVGGLVEATREYRGAVLVRPQAPADLAAGITRAADSVGQTFETGHSWETTSRLYAELYDTIAAPRGTVGRSTEC